MDYIVHGVANSWTQLNDFHFHFSSPLSAMMMVSSAYLRLLTFLLAMLIPACASSSPAFHMMYSANKLNKQGSNIQPWCTPFSIWNHSGSMIMPQFSSVQFNHSVVSYSATPWIVACQASLSNTNSRSSPKIMSIELVMPSSHLILCCSLLLPPPIPPSIRVFSNQSTLRVR